LVFPTEPFIFFERTTAYYFFLPLQICVMLYQTNCWEKLWSCT